MTNHSPLIVLVGPTGIGKSALALHLAQTLPAEVVSGDSRQIYKGLDIGTAKVTRTEQEQVPHHLIDIVAPDRDFSLAEYQERAYAVIAEIAQRGHWPLLVGGTGQYVRAVVQGWRIPRVPPDPDLRAELYAEAQQAGAPALYERLIALDVEVEPVEASKYHLRRANRPWICQSGRGHSKCNQPLAVLRR